MSALFGFNARSSVRSAMTVQPEKPLSLPYELRTEMNWVDFSGTANPLGTPKSFVRAMHAALVDGELDYMPDRSAHAFRAVLARRFGVAPESFLCGTSVSEMVRSVAQTYRPCSVGVVSPAAPEFMLAVANAGHEVVELASPHAFVVPDVHTAHDIGLAFDAAVLANPTYPTSRLLPRQTLVSYLETCAWVVVDESLIELTLGGESMVPLIDRYRNLVIVRSLSSAFAIPGVPISYCIAHPDTIIQIERFFDNTGLSMFAEVLGAHVCSESSEYFERTREFLDAEIPWMQCMLNLIPGIQIFPAEANFVMCAFDNAAPMNLAVANTSELVLRLQLAGFLVRKLDGMPGIVGGKYFCVGVRTREENEKLLSALREIVVGERQAVRLPRRTGLES